MAPDQISQLQLMLSQQTKRLEQQETAFNAFMAAKKEEATEAERVKKELEDLQLAFDQLQTASPGGGRSGGAHGGVAAGGGGGGGGRLQMNPVNVAKMDACPAAGKEQAMGEWTTLAKRWARALPPILKTGEGRFRAHTAVTAGLNGKPRVKNGMESIVGAV